MKIIVYTKQNCPWGIEVVEWLKAQNLPFEEREMLANPQWKEECIAKSGIFKCPTLDIDGHILADSDANQVAEYLESLKA